MKFNTWIDTFLEEKGIDLEETFEIKTKLGTSNIIPYAVIIEHMKIASPADQNAIKELLIMIDFKNRDVKHFLRHLGQAIAHD